MKDAWSTADLSILKTRPQRAVWYAAVHKPASVYSASIANALATFPASALNVTTIDGATTDVKAGMTLRVGANAGGSSKGIIRVREDMTGSVLQIAEAGSGLVSFQQNDVVTVMDQFLPWTKHPKENTATSQWRVDFQPYDNQLSLYGPHVNLGPPAAAFLDGGTATVNYIGSRSFSASGGTFTTYAWLFPDASTADNLGTEAAPIAKVYSNASKSGSYVSFTITDSNGVSAIGRRLVWAFDDRTQPHRVEFADITGGIRKGGYKANLKVSTTATADDFPDMAEIIIFEEASYGGTASTIGGNFPWRSNIVFRGWIDGKTVNINPFSGDVMFSAVTINGIMDKLESYDLFLGDMSTDASAKDWIGASALTTERTAWQLLTHRSTIGTLVDFSSAGGYASKINVMLYQEFPRSPLWKQMSRMYREYGTYGYVAADMQSNLYGMNDAQITGGSALLPLNEITKQDRRDTVTVKEKTIDENVEAHFLSVSSDIPLWVRTPGDVMGYYGKKKEHARGLYADQQTLTQWVGNWAAKLNSNYPATTIPLAGNLRYDSVPQSRISLSLSATDNIRGYSWDNKEFLPYQTKVHYNSETGTVLTDIEVEEVVDGVGGSAVTFPKIETTPTQEPEPDWEPPPLPGPTPGDGMGTVYVMIPGKLYRTSDFSAGTPVYTELVSDSCYDFILDPWAPATTGYLIKEDGLYKSTNLNATTPTWSVVLTEIAIEDYLDGEGFIRDARHHYKVIASINFEGYVGMHSAEHRQSNDERRCLVYSYSSDGGDTWNHSTIYSKITILDEELDSHGALDYVPHNVNEAGHVVLYFAYHNYTSGGATNRVGLRKSIDSGATWQDVPQTAAGADAKFLSCPYDGNEAGNILWFGDNNNTYKSTDSGVTLTNIEPGGLPSIIKRTGVETYTYDNNLVYFWDSSNDLYTSADGGGSWTQKNATGVTGTVCAAGGFPYNSAQYYVVTTTGVFVSTDGGDTFIDKTGDIPSVAGANRTRTTIVPNWLE